MFHSYGTVSFGLSASFSLPPEPALINDVTRHLFVRTSVGSGLLSQPFDDILEDAGSLQSSKSRLTFEGMVRHSRCRSDARIQRNPRCGQSCRRGSRNNRPRVSRTSWAAGGGYQSLESRQYILIEVWPMPVLVRVPIGIQLTGLKLLSRSSQCD
jgi:hypothetical protein